MERRKTWQVKADMEKYRQNLKAKKKKQYDLCDEEIEILLGYVRVKSGNDPYLRHLRSWFLPENGESKG